MKENEKEKENMVGGTGAGLLEWWVCIEFNVDSAKAKHAHSDTPGHAAQNKAEV